MKRTLRAAAAGVALTFLLGARYLASLSDPWNRLELAWTRLDAAAVASLLLAGGLVGIVSGELGRRLKPRLAGVLLLLIVVLAVWPTVDSIALPVPRRVDAAVKLAALATIGYFVLRRSDELARLTASTLVLIAPVAGLYAAYLFTRAPVPAEKAALSITDRSPGPPAPVFLFLFDEWSYRRTFIDGDVAAPLRAFDALSASSFVCHRAASPGENTIQSVPRILGEPSDLRRGRPFGFRRSLVDTAHAAGRPVFVAGAYLPYTTWFNAIADACFSVAGYRSPAGGFIDAAKTHFVLGVMHPLTVWNAALAKRLETAHDAARHPARIAALHRRAMSALALANDRSFVYLHYPLPHPPLLTGTYEGNLEAADRLFGEAMAEILDRKLWDKSLIIVTSDHAWRDDPALEGLSPEARAAALRHVPLFVKMPGQKRRVDVNDPVAVADIQWLVERAWGSTENSDKIPAPFPKAMSR